MTKKQDNNKKLIEQLKEHFPDTDSALLEFSVLVLKDNLLLEQAIKDRCIKKGIFKADDLDALNLKDSARNLIETINPQHENEFISYHEDLIKEDMTNEELLNQNPYDMIDEAESSAAMAFNIFGNGPAKLKNHYVLGLLGGAYDVEYKKQLAALKDDKDAPYADVYLKSKNDKNMWEISLIDANMTEWLKQPPTLLPAEYGVSKNYPLPKDLVRKLMSLRKYLTAKKPVSNEEKIKTRKGRRYYICAYKRFDAFRFYRQICGICAALFGGEYLEEKLWGSLPENISQLTLVDLYWTIPADMFTEEPALHYDTCQAIETKYRSEFLDFKKHAWPVIDLINKKGKELIGDSFNFDIQLLDVNVMIACLEKTPEQMEYLKRYI